MAAPRHPLDCPPVAVFAPRIKSGAAPAKAGGWPARSVAGGELTIPTLIFVLGADIHTAGSAVLFVSIPTVCLGRFRYRRRGLLAGRPTLLRIALPIGVESFVGAAAGGAFAGTTSAGVLKLMPGMILVAASFKAFWRH